MSDAARDRMLAELADELWCELAPLFAPATRDEGARRLFDGVRTRMLTTGRHHFYDGEDGLMHAAIGPTLARDAAEARASRRYENRQAREVA